MCGVAAIFGYHPVAPPVSRDELLAIRDAMVRRGPDGCGAWYSEDGRAGLGHRRLSIIDLTPSGAQPMVSADGRYVVTFNGEIYNYRSLRRDLERDGTVFRTQSDTEVLLHLYARFGIGMFSRLRGMFALAVWDTQSRTLLLARDPYGIKPLYFADDGWTVRVASQVKAILAGGGVSTVEEPAGVVGFHLFGSVPEPFTLYREVHAVPPGTTIRIGASGPSEAVPYFDLSEIWYEAESVDAPSEPDAIGEVAAAVSDSVAHHLVADVPVGLFLSAGIDSGALACAMVERSSDSPRAITLGFEEYRGTPGDETPLASEIAAKLGLNHQIQMVKEEDFRRDVDRILEDMDQPSIDGVNTWYVSRAAHEIGLRVAISGLGGDELFGGYPSFRDLPRWRRLLSIPSRIPGLAWLTERFTATFPQLVGSSSPKAPGLVRYGGTLEGAYLLRRGLFLPEHLPRFLDPDIVEVGLTRLRWKTQIGGVLRSAPSGQYPRSNHARISILESRLYMLNQLLRDTDWASMAHSLEVRVPFVDADILRRLAPLLVRARPASGKGLLGASHRGLPDSVLHRPKSGFTTPVGDWQRTLTGFHPNGPWARSWGRWVMGHFMPSAR